MEDVDRRKECVRRWEKKRRGEGEEMKNEEKVEKIKR